MTTWENAKTAFEKQLKLNLRQLGNRPPSWNYFLNCLEEMKHKINRVVDVGCGVGIYYKLCKDYFPDLKYLGIDYSPYAITLAITKWDHFGFFNLDYAELKPKHFTQRDLLVANAFCDVREDGDKCFEYLLKLKVPYLLFQRVKLTTEPSFFRKYRAYQEIDTVEFHHNQKQMFKTIIKHDYMSIWDLEDKKNNDYNIFLMKNPFTENRSNE